MTYYHPKSGLSGTVDSVALHPDGRVLIRIEDHWLFADEAVALRGHS